MKKLIVVKVGTSSLTEKDGRMSPEKAGDVIRQICDLRDEGHRVVLVSSGAIAAGFHSLGYTTRPQTIAAKQASAAVGQGLLLEEYTSRLESRGYVGAQILLTRDDFADKRRYTNAFNALEILIKRGAVPIINENDTIAVDELKLGDNDTLASQVAAMLHADLLILLTDVAGLYTGNPTTDPEAKRIPVVERITPEIRALAGDAGSHVGTGGMITKIRGATLATKAGVPVFICSSKNADSIKQAVSGEAEGTLFKAEDSLKTKLQWMAFYSQSAGNLYIDRGAADAVTQHGRSLLPAGIRAVEGDFKAGDVVKVYLSESHEYLGLGIVNYSREELLRMIELCESGRGSNFAEAIHHDNWVNLEGYR